MVKRISKLLMVVLLVVLCVSLAGCKDNEEKKAWAEKITDRYARYMDGSAKTPYSYTDLMPKIIEEFGESNYGSVNNVDIQGATGILYWIDGSYSTEQIANRVKKGQKLKGLAISFAYGIAVDAYYGDLKEWL